jgi:hypothetical protein
MMNSHNEGGSLRVEEAESWGTVHDLPVLPCRSHYYCWVQHKDSDSATLWGAYDNQ